MATLSLSEVQNDYGTYRGNSLVGELGSVGTVPNAGLEGINGVNAPFLNGIVLRIDDTLYTDTGYLNQLKLAGNPYIDINTLPTVVVTLKQLTSFGDEPLVNGFGGLIPQSQYAETSGFSPMSSVTKVLQYLNDFFNPNTTDVTLSPVSVGTLGSPSPSSYFVDVDLEGGSYAGMQFDVNPKRDGVVTPSQPPGDPVVTEPAEPIEIEVNDVPTPVSIIKQKPELIDVTSPDITRTNTFTETTGPNAQLVKTLSSYQTGNTYGYTNTGVVEPTKPTGTGSYTGERRTASDGSSWVWIPGLGGWTKA